MKGPFILRPDGTIEARLTAIEADVLTRVAEQVAMVAADPEANAAQRLYPPAYRDDAALDEQFRDLTRSELTTGKTEAARSMIGSIEGAREKRSGERRVTLDEDASRSWLSVLNDARLILGTAMDVDDDFDHVPLPPDDPRASEHNLYLYLSGLEEMLVDVLSARDIPPDPMEETPWE